MKRYAKYKPSGVAWIEEIPEHWEVKRLKFLGKIKYGLGTLPKLKPDGFRLIRATDIQKGEILDAEMVFVDPDDVPYDRNPVLKENDIVVVRSGAYTGDSAIIHREYEGSVVGYDMVLRVTRANALFVSYCLLSHYVLNLQIYRHRLRAAQPHLNREELGETLILIPDDDEQHSIAEYLDPKTAQIDDLIVKKQRLIDLLNEEKAAVINHAATKGLKPSAPMKDSGNARLGEIPTHWEVKKLKYWLKSVTGGGTPSTNNPDYWNGDIPWVSPKDMKVDLIVQTEDYVTKQAIDQSSTNLVPANRILIVVRSGILKHTLPLAINSIPVAINQDMKALEPNDGLDMIFLHWKLKGQSKEILTFCNKLGATVDSIEMEDFMDLDLAIPPALEEQRLIARNIESSNQQIDSAISKIKKEIELLQEYRTALISEVVTGKIDVRGAH